MITPERRQEGQSLEIQVLGASTRMVRDGGEFRKDDTPELKNEVAQKLQLVTRRVNQMANAVTESQEISFNLERFVAERYQPARKSLEAFQIIPEGITVPSAKKVQETLENKLTPEQLKEIGTFEKPVLLLKPKTSGIALVKAFDKKKLITDQSNTFVSDNAQRFLERADQGSMVEWQVVITEGASSPAVLKVDDITQTIEERFQSFLEQGRSIDMKEYILLQMLQLSENQGIPLDDLYGKDSTWTMLGMKNYVVAGGNFYDGLRQLFLNDFNSLYKFVYARFRRSVVVDV